jgi:mRNA interferase HigB
MSLGTLREFWESNPAAEQELREWAKVVRKAAWRSFHEVRQDLRSADNLGDGWVCFDIRRNDFRLIAIVVYDFKMVLVKFVGTHAEYDRLMKNRNWKERL